MLSFVRLLGLPCHSAMFADAATNPLTGIVSDGWKSAKYGRRHPFLFAAPVPLSVSVWFIFRPPAVLLQPAVKRADEDVAMYNRTDGSANESQQLALFGWLALWTILSRAFLTLYAVPHAALGGELSDKPHERSQLFSGECNDCISISVW